VENLVDTGDQTTAIILIVGLVIMAGLFWIADRWG
jgi:LPXTG-motif cell wall-anchored protein